MKNNRKNRNLLRIRFKNSLRKHRGLIKNILGQGFSERFIVNGEKVIELGKSINNFSTVKRVYVGGIDVANGKDLKPPIYLRNRNGGLVSLVNKDHVVIVKNQQEEFVRAVNGLKRYYDALPPFLKLRDDKLNKDSKSLMP